MAPSQLANTFIEKVLASKKPSKFERRMSDSQSHVLTNQSVHEKYQKQIDFFKESLIKFKQEKQAEVTSELFVTINN